MEGRTRWAPQESPRGRSDESPKGRRRSHASTSGRRRSQEETSRGRRRSQESPRGRRRSPESPKGRWRSHESPRRKRICPSKTTVYLANLPYSLTDSDLIKLLDPCGTIVSAKVVKDKFRRSKGIAFVQFLEAEDAFKCIEQYNKTEMFGRKWVCSIAKENGRAVEFIKKRTYSDKSSCYECGEFGHLSNKCLKNVLGDRDRVEKRQGYKRKSVASQDFREETKAVRTEGSRSDCKTASYYEEDLASAIRNQREYEEEQEYREVVATGQYRYAPERDSSPSRPGPTRRSRYMKDEYFSDEETLRND